MVSFCFKIDTTQGTASDRYNFYINGVETEYGGTGGETVTTSYPSQNTQFLWVLLYNTTSDDVPTATLMRQTWESLNFITRVVMLMMQQHLDILMIKQEYGNQKKFTGSYGSAGGI